MGKYKCPTLGDCNKANSGEIFERSPGEDLKCPGCGTLLEPQITRSDSQGVNKIPLIAAVVGVIALIAMGGYFYKKSATVIATPVIAIEPPVASVAIPIAIQTAPPLDKQPSESGLPPSSAETRELRQDSDIKLSKGDASGAELASNKAASNEMLKVAIAKMAQGKLDEAEKEFDDVLARDPKQFLVYYNKAILRVKQKRSDDALKELEASFMAGFPFFDKMDMDNDFDGLRKNPRFTELVARYRSPSK